MNPIAPEPPESGYEVTPGLIGRASRRRWAAAGIAVVALVAVVVVKPWVGPADHPAGAVAAASATPTPSTVTASATVTRPGTVAVAAPTPTPVPGLAETWPVTPIAGSAFAGPDTVDPSATTALSSYIGAWGVAAFGDGPRFVRDQPWVDWFPVAPKTSTGAADRIATWPGTGVCSGTPIVPDLPQLVAVTTPTGIPAGPVIEGWWSDGGRTASLDGSIRELSGSGRRGVTYLQRIDGTLWPAGRYEFHVSSGDQIVALVVCLDRTG